MPVGTGLNQVPTQIREVTSLAPSGTGSLHEAITTDAMGAGAIIDFDVAGNINRIGMADLEIIQPGFQLRGETAPGEGINLVGCGIRVKRSGTVLQNFRIVPGDKPGLPSPDNRDCIGVEGESADIWDTLIKGMTLAYAVDGLLDFWSTRIKRISVVDCIFAEPLNASIHPSGAHSTAFLAGLGGEDVLIARNLFANYGWRGPAIRGPFNGALVNNLYYNPRDNTYQLYGNGGAGMPGGAILLAIVGNHAVMGPSLAHWRNPPPGHMEPCVSAMSAFPASRVHQSDNLTTWGAFTGNWATSDAWPATTPVIAALGYALMTSTNPVDMTGLTPMTASAVKAFVLANAGPRRADGTLRDSPLEARIRGEVNNGATGSLKNTIPAAEAAYFGFPSPPPLTYGGIDDAPILAEIKAEAEARYADNQVTDTTLLPSGTYTAVTALLSALNVGAGQPLATVDAVRAAALSGAAELEALVESIDRQRANNTKPYWQG